MCGPICHAFSDDTAAMAEHNQAVKDHLDLIRRLSDETA